MIVSCLPDSPEVEEVHLGRTEPFSGAARGAIVIDTSTTSAESAARDDRRPPRRIGHLLLDAPVSGGQKGAAEGTLTFFVGARCGAARAGPARLRRDGQARDPSRRARDPASSAKAANQILVAGNLLALSEAMAFAAKAGLPLDALHAALTGGAANSWALEVLGSKMIDRDFRPAFAIKHQQKDLAILLATARRNGVPLPGAALVHQLLSALEAQGRGDEGTQALLTLYEQMAVRPEGPGRPAALRPDRFSRFLPHVRRRTGV